MGGQYANHVIWDNNSSDGTQEWLREIKHPNTTIICSERNINDLPAYNELARSCKTKYFMAINPNTRITGPFDAQPALSLFIDDPELMLVGHNGPSVKFVDVSPCGVGGWGWVPRLLVERDMNQPEDINTAHVQTWFFFADCEKFLQVGGFDIRNRRFDLRWPDDRFPEKPLDLLDKGNLIAAEIELSVRAVRLGFHIAFLTMPFYHYFSHGQQATVKGLDEGDAGRGLSPIGYQSGMYGEDKFIKEVT